MADKFKKYKDKDDKSVTVYREDKRLNKALTEKYKKEEYSDPKRTAADVEGSLNSSKVKSLKDSHKLNKSLGWSDEKVQKDTNNYRKIQREVSEKVTSQLEKENRKKSDAPFLKHAVKDKQ